MSENTQKPDFCTEEHLEYLDGLRESRVTNMFGARPYLMANYQELSSKEATNILSYWMKSFEQRHPLG